VYEYFEELDEMNWSARGNVLNQYLSNTSIWNDSKCDEEIGICSFPVDDKFARGFQIKNKNNNNNNTREVSILERCP
jgi:hypothetical protein